MEPARLARVFKALALFTDSGPLGTKYTRINVLSPTRLEATDRHRLMRVDVPGGHGLAVGGYDPKVSAALLKVGQPIAPVEQLDTWPPFDQVIPPKSTEPGVSFAIDPKYLAQAADALVDALAIGRKAICVQPPRSNLDPVRIDATGEDASAVIVVKPIRV